MRLLSSYRGWYGLTMAATSILNHTIMKTTGCGDWHLGWGFSGYNHLGILSTEDYRTFHWRGSSQGRHGQKGNAGAHLEYQLSPDLKWIGRTVHKGHGPVMSEVVKAMNELRSAAGLPLVESYNIVSTETQES